MALLQELIDMHGSIEGIPVSEIDASVKDEIEGQGYVVFRGEVIHVSQLNDDQHAEALGIDLGEIDDFVDRDSWSTGHVIRVKKDSRKAIDRVFGDRLRRLKDADFHKYMLERSDGEVDGWATAFADEPGYTNTSQFVRAFADYLEQRKISDELAERFGIHALDQIRRRNLDSVKLEDVVHAEFGWNKEKLNERELEATIGFNHVFGIKERVKSKVDELAEQFSDIPGVTEFLAETYGLPYLEDSIKDRLYGFSGEIEAHIEDGKIVDNYLREFGTFQADDFEREMKEHGVAIGFLRSAPWLSDGVHESEVPFLEKIHRRERPDAYRQPEKLVDAVSGESKRKKIVRLCEEDEGYKKQLEEHLEGKTDYVDSLKHNQEITKRLKELEINTDVFYYGIPEHKFVSQGGNPVSEEEIRKNVMKEYSDAMISMFEEGVLHRKGTLEDKIKADLKNKNEIEVPKDSDLVEFITNDLDDGSIRTVCSTTLRYASQGKNVEDSMTAQANAFHLRTVGKFMKGELKTEDGASGDVYTIKLESKDPIRDIDIGNDGGCCIGIYERGQFGDFDDEEMMDPEVFEKKLRAGGIVPITSNGRYMGVYLEDRATSFVGIYKGRERVGMALVFAGENEREESLLMANSVELSERLRGTHVGNVLSAEAEKYISSWAKEAGFKHALIGDESDDSLDFEEVKKIHPSGREFYSDYLDEMGEGDADSWSAIK